MNEAVKQELMQFAEKVLWEDLKEYEKELLSSPKPSEHELERLVELYSYAKEIREQNRPRTSRVE